ncbi:MAG: hypothetical protein IT536_01175 [Hyphomicrobiales bacterium]|nr:hypothetical protein [Hyphomicrobiales bacterium]
MERLRKTVVLLAVSGLAGAAAPWLGSTPDLCFTAGAVTYRLSTRAAPDYRIAIDNAAAHPDLRVQLVDRVEAADFALTDDAGTMTGKACDTASAIRTVRVVAAGTPADLTVALSPRPDPAAFSLYVHSARVGHAEAAALFALVHRAPDTDRALDGEPDHVAAIR